MPNLPDRSDIQALGTEVGIVRDVVSFTSSSYLRFQKFRRDSARSVRSRRPDPLQLPRGPNPRPPPFRRVRDSDTGLYLCPKPNQNLLVVARISRL